jgi:hypothetical protein
MEKSTAKRHLIVILDDTLANIQISLSFFFNGKNHEMSNWSSFLRSKIDSSDVPQILQVRF